MLSRARSIALLDVLAFELNPIHFQQRCQRLKSTKSMIDHNKRIWVFFLKNDLLQKFSFKKAFTVENFQAH